MLCERVFVPPVQCWVPDWSDDMWQTHCLYCTECAREFVFFQFSSYFFFSMEGIVVDNADEQEQQQASETVEKQQQQQTKKRQRAKKDKVKVSCLR